jgi:hypothetical protein
MTKMVLIELPRSKTRARLLRVARSPASVLPAGNFALDSEVIRHARARYGRRGCEAMPPDYSTGTWRKRVTTAGDTAGALLPQAWRI